MRCQLIYSFIALSLLGLSLGPAAAQQPADSGDTTPSVEPGIDVQTRGPVHEAFAQPYNPDPQPTPIVPRQPPPPIPEQPPEQKPAGENVQWIPGYWAWDADRNDFTWVSGCWRVPPPGRQWVAGSWTQADGGWRWVPGYWNAVNQQPLVFEQPPPASVENGPSTPAPDDNSFYVPGCWVNRDNHYLWRPGFWQAFQPGWIWTDAQYTWTPQGCVFTDGYWDYGLEDRGIPFAPVAFTQPLWDTPGWCYRPGFALGWDGLFGSLFARPRYGHYYFGDYYGARYRRAGFEPWHLGHGHLRDSLFDYYRWQHRGDRGWYAGVVNTYRGRRQGSLPRPPRTFAEQTRLFHQGHGGHELNQLRMVTSVHQLRGSQAHFRTTGSVQRVDVRSAGSVSHARNLVDHANVSSIHQAVHGGASAARPLPRPGSRYAEVQRAGLQGAHLAQRQAELGRHPMTPASAHGVVAAQSHPAGQADRTAARPQPRPGSRYAEAARTGGPQGPHLAQRQAGLHARPMTPTQAHGAVAQSHPGARSARPAARPQPARGYAAASARLPRQPAARPQPARGYSTAARSRPAPARQAQPRQVRQPSQPARTPRATAAPRRAASPRQASPPRQRPAAAPRAARAPSRPAPRSSGGSGSARSGKHR